MMEIITSFFPAYEIIIILTLLFFNSGSSGGEANFLMTVGNMNLIEGKICYELEEGEEKIAVNFTQYCFLVEGEPEKQIESYILRFDKGKIYTINNSEKSCSEADVTESFENIFYSTFKLKENEENLLHKWDLGESKYGYYLKLSQETGFDTLLMVKDEAIDNLTVSAELRSESSLVQVNFFPTENEIDAEIFEVPEGYKKI